MDGPVILVVDDHAAIRAALAELTRSAFPNYTVLECSDAAHGLAAAKQHRPELAVVDVALRDMDGLELVARLRNARPGISVLVASQHWAPLLAARAYALGACGFIAKQRLHDEIVPAIAKALALRGVGGA